VLKAWPGNVRQLESVIERADCVIANAAPILGLSYETLQ
jgi:transcriptional regulator with PAS, ATPase and Fis domain